MPYFLYEVSIYRITRNMASVLGSKYYKSDKPLTIKSEEIIVKQTKDYYITKSIDVIGVTKEFVEENNLEVYESRKPKKIQRKSVTIRRKRK